jgi:hypothetical protein
MPAAVAAGGRGDGGAERKGSVAEDETVRVGNWPAWYEQSQEQRTREAALRDEKASVAAQEKAREVALRNERASAAAREREQARYRASPTGQADAAYERGDVVFQFFMDVKNTEPHVIAMVGATTSTTTSDPSAILNSICSRGWEIVNGSFVFHELGSSSRDKFLSSGQNIAVRGTIIGYYLFRRCPENRVD